MRNALELNETVATALADFLQREYPQAKVSQLPRGYSGVEVSPGRYVIVDPDDWDSDRKMITRKIVENAKNGDLDAVKFLLEHSDFKFPSFDVNGDYREE